MFLGRLSQPPLDDRPNVELKSLGHGVQEDHLVFCDRDEMQIRFNLNT